MSFQFLLEYVQSCQNIYENINFKFMDNSTSSLTQEEKETRSSCQVVHVLQLNLYICLF